MNFDDATDARMGRHIVATECEIMLLSQFFFNLIALSSDKSDMCKAHSVGPEKGQAMGQL